MAVAARKRAGAARTQATREKVVAAAGPLFVERGYLDTTMAELAAAAGVAVQTLYLSFGSKAAVLEATLDIAAPDQPTGWPSELDGPAVLAAHVATTCAVVERRHPLDAVLRGAAADAEPAALLAATRRASLASHARAVDELAERPGFTPHLSLQRATDVMAALLAPETYALLVVEQAWTAPDWSEWALRHLTADLLPAP